MEFAGDWGLLGTHDGMAHPAWRSRNGYPPQARLAGPAAFWGQASPRLGPAAGPICFYWPAHQRSQRTKEARHYRSAPECPYSGLDAVFIPQSAVGLN